MLFNVHHIDWFSFLILVPEGYLDHNPRPAKKRKVSQPRPLRGPSRKRPLSPSSPSSRSSPNSPSISLDLSPDEISSVPPLVVESHPPVQRSFPPLSLFGSSSPTVFSNPPSMPSSTVPQPLPSTPEISRSKKLQKQKIPLSPRADLSSSQDLLSLVTTKAFQVPSSASPAETQIYVYFGSKSFSSAKVATFLYLAITQTDNLSIKELIAGCKTKQYSSLFIQSFVILRSLIWSSYSAANLRTTLMKEVIKLLVSHPRNFL